MNILVFDNYDSFTYNLVHLLRELHDPTKITVQRNNQIELENIDRYDKILLSPGPGVPSEAGIMYDLLREYSPTKSILGVCLGHQGIGEVFGSQLHNMEEVLHGVATENVVLNAEEKLFRGLPQRFQVGRYHSWVVVRESIPNENLEITAEDENGMVMGITHRKYDVRGVQFHPESVLTQHGKKMIKNWLNY